MLLDGRTAGPSGLGGSEPPPDTEGCRRAPGSAGGTPILLPFQQFELHDRDPGRALHCVELGSKLRSRAGQGCRVLSSPAEEFVLAWG